VILNSGPREKVSMERKKERKKNKRRRNGWAYILECLVKTTLVISTLAAFGWAFIVNGIFTVVERIITEREGTKEGS